MLEGSQWPPPPLGRQALRVAMVAAGTPPTIATRSALAMAAIGNRLADMAADAALRGRRDPGRAHAE